MFCSGICRKGSNELSGSTVAVHRDTTEKTMIRGLGFYLEFWYEADIFANLDFIIGFLNKKQDLLTSFL